MYVKDLQMKMVILIGVMMQMVMDQVVYIHNGQTGVNYFLFLKEMICLDWLLVVELAEVLGLMLIIRPDEGVRFATVLLGISLIFEGILNLVTALTAVKIMRSSQSSDDIIDIEINE